MQLSRTLLLVAILFALLAGSMFAQSNKKLDPDAGYIPVVAPEDKKKKKGDEVTQALAAPPELPAAVTAETGRLTYQVTPLSSKGLLSQQTRDALKALLKSNHGPIAKLRAFVAGSGDLRRVGEIVGEMFQEKHLALPALSVAQVGALPLEGAQVVIEATEVDRKIVNPNGVAFLAGQPAASVQKSLDQLKRLLASAASEPSDALAVTCIVSSLEDQPNTGELLATSFPSAAIDYVQMQRGPVTPEANCEAVARLRTLGAGNSQVALVASPQVVITGTQLAFGNQDSDFKLAFERLEKTLTAAKASSAGVVRAHLYVTASGLSTRVLAVQSAKVGAVQTPAATLVPVESLPSLDAVFGIDVIAVPESAGPRP